MGGPTKIFGDIIKAGAIAVLMNGCATPNYDGYSQYGGYNGNTYPQQSYPQQGHGTYYPGQRQQSSGGGYGYNQNPATRGVQGYNNNVVNPAQQILNAAQRTKNLLNSLRQFGGR